MLQCKSLLIDYLDQNGNQSEETKDNKNQQIRHMEAGGGVILTKGDQVANGETGDFDAKSNTATLHGHVTLNSGQKQHTRRHAHS